ncbi:MAG: DUF1559 domain-containing protein, partial [Gemmataceae bacterium]
WTFSGVWPLEPRATVANTREKKLRLPPGNYYMFVSVGGERVEQRLLTIGWGGSQTLAIAAPPANPSANPSAEGGFVSLFNGKDLSGWKELPAGRGSWTVENGVLVGKGWPSHLFTERGDFTNFHLRMELRVRAGKNAGALGVFSRVPVEDPGVVLSTDEGMGFSRDRVLVPKLYGGADVPAPKYRPHPVVSWGGDLKGETVGVGMRVTPDEWMTCEFVLDAGQSSLFVKTERGADNTHSRYNSPPKAAGHLALQLFDAWSVVEIRKIEIKELPPTADADRLKGEWLVVSATSGGETVTPKAGEEPVLDFGPKEYGITAPAVGLRVSGSYRLDPARGELSLNDPRTGPLFLPIGYRFDGDRLRLTPPAGAFDDLIATDRLRSLNNLKQLAIAAHNYHDNTSTLPPVGLPAPTGDDLTPRLSWRVALLPFIEQDALYKQFKLDESWDSEHNKKLIAKMPKVFATPGAKASPGHTHYRAFTGPGTALEPGRNPRQGPKFPVDFTDGSANTLLFVEAAEPTVWTKPDDLPFDSKKPLPKLREVDGGVNVTFADGRGAVLALPIKDDVLQALVTRNGGEVPRFTELARNGRKDPVVLECVRKGAAQAPPEPPAPPAPPRPADVDSLRKLVAAHDKVRDFAKVQVETGVVNKRQLYAAEVRVLEARVKLAEVEGRADGVPDLLEKLVEQRTLDRDFVAQRVNAGLDNPSDLAVAEEKLAEVKARLDKVRPPDKLKRSP